LPDGFCQHQKSFLIDAGVAGEIAFVGGINLLRSSMAAPGHESGESDHDLYLEIAGPAASDVHHNFVQRWNEASDRDRPDARWSGAGDAGDLEYPSHLSRPAGEVPVQMTRTVLPRRYRDDTATPGGKPFAIAGGETSVREQYLLAISAARRSIYLENQAIGSPAVVAALAAALERRVAVTVLVPGNAHPQFVEARRDPRAAFFFEQLAALGDHENFTLAALARCRGDGHYDEIYVHAKVALIDDVWATIGSTNVADRSFANDTELNASFWHPASVRALRVDLFQEHLGRDTGALSDIEALALYRESAFANRDRRTLWEPLDGLVYAIDPADYGA
jgi:phosphatidylserine/phosphatidylglycerophosphate/cardiolipin synthase-like enzyme